MSPKNALYSALTAVFAFAGTGCLDLETAGLSPATGNTDPLVFDDALGNGVIFQAFQNSKLDAVSIDLDQKYKGFASAKITIPAPGQPVEWFSGGAVTTEGARDLSGYDALTFWARASRPDVTLDVVGLGNDNTGTSRFEASWSGIELSPTWEPFTLPIPLPDKLTAERGLMFFAEGHDNSMDYEIWFDEVRFENLGTLGTREARLDSSPFPLGVFVGQTVEPPGGSVIFSSLPEQTIAAAPGYFTFVSDNEDVVSVVNGEVLVVGPGSAILTAQLGTVDATGRVRIEATAPPMSAAPKPPNVPEGDVLSLFSNAYEEDHSIDDFLAFGSASVSDLRIGGDDVKAYTNLSFAGISFADDIVDASAMTHFHLDVWTPNASTLRVKLVDFGADGRFGGINQDRDSEHELSFSATTDPALVNGTWVALDIPLSEFANLTGTGHLAQLIVSILGFERTVFIDNFYFHR